jgi:hypothetical protein
MCREYCEPQCTVPEVQTLRRILSTFLISLARSEVRKRARSDICHFNLQHFDMVYRRENRSLWTTITGFFLRKRHFYFLHGMIHNIGTCFAVKSHNSDQNCTLNKKNINFFIMTKCTQSLVVLWATLEKNLNYPVAYRIQENL